MKKINIYIDWFNLYYALSKHIKKKNWAWEKKLQWCDFKKLINTYLKKDEKINNIYFFTAEHWVKEKRNKQKNYIKALHHSWVKVIKWKFSKITRTFINKMQIKKILFNLNIKKSDENKYIPKLLEYFTYEEKRTDVNIALKIQEDAFKWEYNKAIIISWDSDIIPWIESVNKNFPNIDFATMLITWTKWKAIQNKCSDNFIIWYKIMKNSMFQYKININKTETIEIPNEWL